uniref:Protein Abitram n=1 Tax=Oryzias sinensis TaxID=183150 RepID=A0A8C7ZUD9_9TELE
MDSETQKDSELEPPSIIDRYYTRWYRAGKKVLINLCPLIFLFHWISNMFKYFGLKNKQLFLYYRYEGATVRGPLYSPAFKQGGQFLTDFAPLCRITCTDETKYTIYSCIRGRLLEVNENILERPNLLLEKPSTEGYIAVILPKFEESKSVTENLLSRKEFERIVSKRDQQPQAS